MAKTERQRQKKLAKKKSQQLARQRELNRRKNELASLAGRMRTASSGRIAISCFGDSAYEPMGMVPVYFGRYHSSGAIVFTAWMLDNACLGVKDAFCRIIDRAELNELLDNSPSNLVEASPETVLSLIEQSVKFASDIGFTPRSDVGKLLHIFGDTDSTKCNEPFVFGNRDGMPVYIPGPNDSPETIKKITSILSAYDGQNSVGNARRLAG